MKKRTDEDIKLINSIINKINSDKLLKYRGDGTGVGICSAMNLIISLLKAFYGPSINEGIWVAILKKDLGVYNELYDKLFLNSHLLCLVENTSGSYILCDNKTLFYFNNFGNYINLENRKMSLWFNDRELSILYTSELGEHCNVILTFDEDGLVNQREIKKDILPIRVNDMQGYGVSSIITIKRNSDNPCYVSIVESLKITEYNKLTVMPNRKLNGYIHSSSLFDFSDFSKLSMNRDNDVLMGDSCFRLDSDIDRYFPDIRKAFIDRLNKRNGYSRKREKK